MSLNSLDTLLLCLIVRSVLSFVMHQLNRVDYDNYQEYRNELANLNASWKLPIASSLPPSTMSFDYYCSKSDNDIIVTRRRIFIPVCDQFGSSRAKFAQLGGGSHWSMLVWEVIARYYPKGNRHVQFISSFSHFDSCSGYNTDAAAKVAEKLGVEVLQCCETGDDDLDFHVWMEDDPYVVNVVECQVPQQNNGYDCGVYALGYAEAMSSASTQQLYPDGKIDRATTREVYEAVVRAHFEANGGPEAYALRLRKQIGDDIRKLVVASSR